MKRQYGRRIIRQALNCRKQGLLIDPVVLLLIPNDLATVVTEVVVKSLAAFGYRTAHSTDPSLRSAKVSPSLILLAFGVVGAHDVRKYSSACFRMRLCLVRPLRKRIVVRKQAFSPLCAVCSPRDGVNECYWRFFTN